MTKFLASMATLALSWLVSSWTLMLLVGVVHAEWLPQIPTIGFGLALLLGLIFMARAAAGALFGEIVKAVNGGERR